MKKRFFSRFFMSAHQQRSCFLPGRTAFADGLVDDPCEDHLFRIIVGCAELFRPVRNLPVLLCKEIDALGFRLLDQRPQLAAGLNPCRSRHTASTLREMFWK